MAPKTKVVGGVAVAIAEILLHGLNAAQALDYFKSKTPALYVVLVGQTSTTVLLIVALILIPLGIWELRKSKVSPKETKAVLIPEPNQTTAARTHGDYSPARAVAFNAGPGSTFNYHEAPALPEKQTKPKARVVHTATAIVLVNEGPRLHDLTLRCPHPIGTIDVTWERISALPEGAEIPLKYCFLSGSVEWGVTMEMVFSVTSQNHVMFAIVCKDEDRNWWEGQGVLAYDKPSNTWTSSGFETMRPLTMPPIEHRPC